MKRKATELQTPAERRRFFELFGRYAAERYFQSEKIAATNEPSLLALAVNRAEIVTLLDTMRHAGLDAVAADPDGADDAGSSLQEDLSVDAAVEQLAAALSRFESVIPEASKDGTVPADTQDLGIAKAAFLGLRAEQLESLVADDEQGIDDATRLQLADRLAAAYAGREDEIAQLVLGDPNADTAGPSIVTRLIPLRDAPTDLDDVAERLRTLRGRYFETRPAEWFLFREVRRVSTALTIEGELLGYSVSVTEVKGEPRLQPTRQRATVRVTLREGVKWAETNSKRSANLLGIRRVLRATELADPAAGLVAPKAPSSTAFRGTDGRTLWMLERVVSELSSGSFNVDDHYLVSFDRPAKAEDADDSTKRRSRVTSIRLKGTLLFSHPEVCTQILTDRRLAEVDLAIRVSRDGVEPRFQPVLGLRFGWHPDHLMIATREISGSYDKRLHGVLVRHLRQAMDKPVSATALRHKMGVIRRNAGQAESGTLGRVV